MSQYWLVKSEPEECGIDDFVNRADGVIRWDGVRNYQARNFLREMQQGDEVLLYHSSCAHIGVAGILKVAREAYPDPLQFAPESPYFDPKSPADKPRWSAVDLAYVSKAAHILPLSKLKQMAELANSALIKRARLSVMPLSRKEWEAITELGSFAR